MAYLVPAPYTGMSSRDAHLRRNPPSGEPGTDYYMPTGTPLLAPTRCRVVHIGGSVVPATGRFVTLDDGTRWIRFLHLADWRARPGDELEPGDLVAISGASGYGSELFGEPSRNAAFWRNTGGDHVHVTAFRGRGYTFGSSGTVDFHAMTGGIVAGGGATPFNPAPALEGDEMYAMRIAGTDPTRPPVAVSAFGTTQLNEEEFANFYGGPKFDGINARQYDLNLAVSKRLQASPPAEFVGKGVSSNRPWTLFSPGYVKVLSAEEFATVPFSTRRVEGNDRQYDLWKSEALHGQAAAFPVVGVDVDENAIAATVAVMLDRLPDEDAARFAKAVADEQDRRARERLG